MAEPLDLLLQQIDADLDALFAGLRRDIDTALAADRPDLPALQRRINGRLGQMFGFDIADLPDSPMGVYARGALTAARTLGAGQPMTVGLGTVLDGKTTAERLYFAAGNLRGMLVANLRAFALAKPGSVSKDDVRRFFAGFLTVDGAANAIGKTGDHGLYQLRRTLSAEALRENGVGAQVNAQLTGRALFWTLDPRHPKRDICDTHAAADLYGLGRGGYPPGRLPRYPPHPHCLCHIIVK